MGPSLLGLALAMGSQLFGTLIWQNAFDGPVLAVLLYWLYRGAVFLLSVILLAAKWPLFHAAVGKHTAEE